MSFARHLVAPLAALGLLLCAGLGTSSADPGDRVGRDDIAGRAAGAPDMQGAGIEGAAEAGMPAGVAIVDLAMPSTPPTSADVLAERLTILGVEAQVSAAAVAELTGARGFGEVLTDGDILDLLAGQELGGVEGAKIVSLARAYLALEPVTFVGLEPAHEERLLVAHLTGQEGIDPDAAAWFVLASRNLYGDAGALRREEMAGLLVTEAWQLERILEAAASLQPLDGGVPDVTRLGDEVVRRPREERTVDALCRQCPSYDYNLPIPITTYRIHGATLAAGDCKLYRVAVQGGRRYRFTFCEGGGTASFDTVLRASTSQCSEFASNDDSCGVRSQLDIDAPGLGYVWVKVEDKAGRGGTYTLAYKDLGVAVGDCSNCSRIDFGPFTPSANWQTHTSSIAAGSCKLYKFFVYGSQVYEFSFCDGGGTATFDTRLDTRRGNCLPGPSNDDFCAGGRSALQVQPDATQYLYVRVSGNGGGGTYTLAYRNRTGLCQDCPFFNDGTHAPTTAWNTRGGSVTATRTCTTHRFSVKSNERYKFSFCEGGGTTPFPARIDLYTYNGTTCTLAGSSSGDCGNGSDIEINPGYDGFLYVKVSSLSAATGSYLLAYTIQAQNTCTPPMFGPFTPTDTYQTHSSILPGISPGSSIRVYQFNLAMGQSYIFTMCAMDPQGNPTGGSSTADASIHIHTSACTFLTSAFGGCGMTPQLIYTTGAAGTYYVVLGLDMNPGGTYTLAYKRWCVPDMDSDRIVDCYETNTGTYVSLTNTGTDPNNPDTDADGIMDGDEVLGTLAGLDLPALGCSPVKKNILLEHDWMDESTSGCNCTPLGAHSHRPTPGAIALVTAAFANSPVTNPDGTTGIAMINDYGQGPAPFTGGNYIGTDALITGGVNGMEFNGYKAANFAANRNGYFHYTLHAHEYDSSFPCSSGQAEQPGDDLLVTLYNCIDDDAAVAVTIMHELGHNLGLDHGGFEACNYKPNYNSIMNYLYTFSGIDADCAFSYTPMEGGDGVMDYSVGTRPDLNETTLNEPDGICGAAHPMVMAVDWNCNADDTEIALGVDINKDIDGTPCGTVADCAGMTLLRDYDDWANIVLGATVLDEGDSAVPDDPTRVQFPPRRTRKIITCEIRPPEH